MRKGEFELATRIHTIERKPQATPAVPPPLLLLLHGYGSNEHDLMGLAPYLDPRFYIVSARAIYDLGFGGYAWYHLYGMPGSLRADAESRDHALDILTKFVTDLPTRIGADPRRVYILGFSQGAIMSLGLALNSPKLVAGIIPCSGYIDPAWLPTVRPEQLAGLNVLLVHGTDDDVIPVEGSRRARDFLATTPAHTAYHEYPIGHGIHPLALPVIQHWLDERLKADADSGM